MLRGERKWQLDYEKDGRRHRPTFPSKEVAEHERSRISTGRVSAKAIWAMMKQSDRDRIILAYHGTIERGHSIYDLLERSHELQPRVGPSLSRVIADLLEEKTNSGRSADYTNNLEVIFNQFAKGRQSVKIDAISFMDVKAFLNSKTLASRSTLRSRLSTLFKFAIRHEYRKDNPCDKLETVTYTTPRPKVFTVEEFRRSVKWLRENAPDGLPWFALSTVCGLRPEEAEKTTKLEINFKEGFVKVEAQTTKVRRRRVVYPKPDAMRFLKWAVKRGKLPLDSQTRKRILSGVVWKSKDGTKRRPGLRHALGFKVWPKDITRHTAASYWLAGEGETVKHVAKMLGHSEAICESRYKAVKTQKEASEFWNVVSSITNKYS